MNVCIVIPIYKDYEALNSYERISLKKGVQTFNEYPIYLTGPNWINWEVFKTNLLDKKQQLSIKVFSEKCFKDKGEYSRLLLSPTFYQSFSQHEYLLIYQDDAFVFKDELSEWCQKDYDYIGAPWFENFSSIENSGNFLGVGNGGFSLRKISSHLKVLHSFAYVTPIKENYHLRFVEKKYGTNTVKNLGGMLLDHTVRNNTHWLLNNYGGYEDQFWGISVPKRFTWFKVPPFEEAAAFAFEMQPRRLFEINNAQLPFGCHAWWKYDLDFWRPHIEKFGYHL